MGLGSSVAVEEVALWIGTCEREGFRLCVGKEAVTGVVACCGVGVAVAEDLTGRGGG